MFAAGNCADRLTSSEPAMPTARNRVCSEVSGLLSVDMDDAAGHLPGAQLAQSLVDHFDGLVADRNWLDLALSHQSGQFAQLLGRAHIGAAQNELTLHQHGQGRLQRTAEKPDIDVGAADTKR